nr:hypothetical protein Iba_chr07bCG0810 [Ipomoea batatas]
MQCTSKVGVKQLGRYQRPIQPGEGDPFVSFSLSSRGLESRPEAWAGVVKLENFGFSFPVPSASDSTCVAVVLMATKSPPFSVSDISKRTERVTLGGGNVLAVNFFRSAVAGRAWRPPLSVAKERSQVVTERVWLLVIFSFSVTWLHITVGLRAVAKDVGLWRDGKGHSYFRLRVGSSLS